MSRLTKALTGPCAAVALATLLAAPTRSAAQAPAQYLWVARITAKLGHVEEWAAFEKQIQEARRRTGDPRSVSVYQLQTGGPANLFHAVIAFDDLSQLDSWPSVPELLQAAYGERDAARMYAEGTATEESVEIEIHALEPQFSSGAAVDPSGTTMVQLVTTRVRPALADDYDAFLSALKMAEDERGIRRVRRSVAMGDLFTQTAVNQATGWSDVRADPGPVAVVIDEYGEDVGGTLLSKANAAVVSRSIEVLRLREDLSYTPD